MKTKIFCAVIAVGLIVLGSTMFASNMAFKIVRDLNLQAGANINYIGLPYNFPDVNSSGTITASDVTTDMGGLGVKVSQLDKWNPATQAWQSYIGGRSVDYALTPGEGLLVKLMSDTDYVIVGSHNPSTVVSISPQAGANINYITVPYHSMSTKASQVCAELGGLGVGVAQIDQWNPATQTWASYIGGRSVDFTLVTGEALLVKLITAQNWTPSHY